MDGFDMFNVIISVSVALHLTKSFLNAKSHFSCEVNSKI